MAVLRTSEIRADDKLPIPRYIRENIIFEHMHDGPSLHWHYHNQRDVAAISPEESISGFEHSKRTKVINNNSNIRPPKQIRDSLNWSTDIGTKVAVYYTEIEEENFLYFFNGKRITDFIINEGGLFKFSLKGR